MYCVGAVAARDGDRGGTDAERLRMRFVYKTSVNALHGSFILSCYHRGVIMPNPLPFLWTVLLMTLASHKLGEHDLALTIRIWMH